MAVYGYVRVSTARQVSEGESLDVQRRMIRGYADMYGLVLDEVVVEESVSGSIPLNERPAGAALMARLQADDIVIAAKLDRMFRSALDALMVVERLRTLGVRLHLLDLGGDIAGNGLSRLFLTIAAAFAEAERDRIRERIMNVKTDQKARGRYLGGRIPFGYRVDSNGNLAEQHDEQTAIYDMSKMLEEKVPLRKIASEMNERGLKVSHETVRRNHRWSYDDDVIAFYIGKYDDDHLPTNKKEIAALMGISVSVLNMRIQNYKYLETGNGGLSHPSSQSRQVFKDFKNKDELEMREVVLQAIAKH